MGAGLGQRFDRPSNYTASLSNNNVKPVGGILDGWMATTTGDIEFKDGTTSVLRVAVTTGASNINVFLTRGIKFNTNISLSASAAVIAVLWR